MSEDGPKGPVEVARVDVRRVTPDKLILQDAFLSRCPVVKLLGAAAESLFRAGTARRYNAGARLFSGGELGNSLFLVLRGEVRLQSTDGKADIGVARRGELLGEMVSGARGCSAVADSETDVVELPFEAVEHAGHVSREFKEHVSRLSESRSRASAEMDDFLKRW